MDCQNSFFFFFDCIVFCHAQKEIGRGFWGIGWLMGKGSQTTIKTDKKSESCWNDWNYVFGLLYAVKQQYILNLTNVWLYFMGRGNMAIAAFFRDLRPWDWSFHFPSSSVTPILIEPSVLVSGMMSCFAKGPHTPQWRINTIHVLFFLHVFFSWYYFNSVLCSISCSSLNVCV